MLIIMTMFNDDDVDDKFNSKWSSQTHIINLKIEPISRSTNLSNI